MKTATFENFVEGGYGLALTDPATGVKFSNPSTGGFSIDYSNDAIFAFPTHYLTGGYYAPGNGASFATNFSFTAVLPNKTDTFSMDMAYMRSTLTDSITIRAYDANGSIVMNFTPSLLSAINTPTSAKVSISSPTKNIQSIQVSSTPLMSAGYDNMTFFPDPQIGCLVIMALAVVSSRFRRRW